MILMYMMACRSVGGSEGFAVDSIRLYHLKGSEGEQEYGSYRREYTGMWAMMVMGGANCDIPPWDTPPEGEGWEKKPTSELSPAEECAAMQSYGGWDLFGSTSWSPGPSSADALTIYINDWLLVTESIEGTAELRRCGPPDPNAAWGEDASYSISSVLSEPLTEVAVEINGSNAHVSGAVDSRLSFNWTLPICELE
jgi:hypothetical protein